MQPERDDTNNSHETGVRWVWAIMLLFILHAGWMTFTAWYLHGADRWVLFGCEDAGSVDPEEGGLLYLSTEPCPPDRPYADVVRWVVPVIGLLGSSVLPPLAVGLSMTSSTADGVRNLAVWIGLCVISPALVMVAVLLVLHTGAIP